APHEKFITGARISLCCPFGAARQGRRRQASPYLTAALKRVQEPALAPAQARLWYCSQGHLFGEWSGMRRFATTWQSPRGSSRQKRRAQATAAQGRLAVPSTQR